MTTERQTLDELRLERSHLRMSRPRRLGGYRAKKKRGAA